MGDFNFELKWRMFTRTLIEKEGYKEVLTGLGNTLQIAILGLFIGIIIGTIISIIRVMPKGKPISKIGNAICGIYVGFFRGTPIVVQLLLGYFVLFPILKLDISQVTCCIVIFGLNSAAYVSEIMRSGIQSVDSGQMEAGRAVGLGYWTAMFKIVIPQAIKNILPTIGNEFISLIKETSVINFIGAMDLANAFKKIGTNSYEFMIPYIVMAICYIILVYFITLLIKIMERSLKKSDRSN